MASYYYDVAHNTLGERYSTIMRYLMPEFITALLLYSMPLWLDAAFISNLKSTPTYAALGVTNNLIHFIVKIAEAFGVGTIILSGQYNGLGDYKKAGRAVRDAFWVTVFLGAGIGGILYAGSYVLYSWYGVTPEIARLGAPFLRIRTFSIVCMFVYFALVGFLRGIKNTRTPMYIFLVGLLVFVLADYALIFGAWGLPQLGLMGSAIASVLQYLVMVLLVAIYIMYDASTQKYQVQLLAPLKDGALAWQLILLSLPVLLDKATLAFAYIWLCKMLSSMGTQSIATFCAIKDMERFAFLGGIAGAQVITFLVSNDCGKKQWEDIKVNIKRVLLISSCMVFSVLAIFTLFAHFFIRIFDGVGDFTDFAARIFPLLSGLAFFDLLQLILSGALRGSGNVQTVMWVRLVICFGYFIPVSYGLSCMNIPDTALKFLLIYGSYYFGNALMSVVYIYKFRTDSWKRATLHKN